MRTVLDTLIERALEEALQLAANTNNDDFDDCGDDVERASMAFVVAENARRAENASQMSYAYAYDDIR
jgi:hypothetical protein